ncbi:MAG: tRNA pseudouridine(55) synthase TruB [Bacillota bacterium]|nr:tRNA pseudouridine(55) synthase TruB [Bacillota bacterium]MDW7682529.1 tRNA pseudouridine(55) synthase TruB [Bacillota bacterium]
MMEGIINVLKPPGMTSHDVVNQIRRLTGVRRTGHTGTLDPGAAGVLPVCVGKATRVSEFVLEMDKSYRAELTLGQATDSEDAAGTVIAEKQVPSLTGELIGRVLKSFIGQGTQIPPMYSAVRVGGKRLYELARQGKEVSREPRTVHIYSVEPVRFDHRMVLFDVDCSRGTYVRTLCREIAEKLDTVGHMSFLLRTAVGPFLLDQTWTLEELAGLAESGRLQEALMPADVALQRLPSVTVSAEQALLIKNGVAVTAGNLPPEGETVRVYDSAGSFLAIGRAGIDTVKPQKVF